MAFSDYNKATTWLLYNPLAVVVNTKEQSRKEIESVINELKP